MANLQFHINFMTLKSESLYLASERFWQEWLYEKVEVFKGLTKFKWDDIGQQHALVTKYTHNESSDAETVVVK